jgi:hypothetical protein
MIPCNCKSLHRPMSINRGQARQSADSADESRTLMTHEDESDANRVVVLEGSPLGTPLAKSFATVEDAENFVIARIRATVSPKLKERFEKALADQVVSEDGVKAVSAVLAGKLAFVRALASAYAPKIAITTRRYDDEDDARR